MRKTLKVENPDGYEFIYKNTMLHFDSMYVSKGIHPGRPFYFYANIGNSLTHLYSNDMQYKVISQAYDKSGALIEDHSVVFLQRSVK